MEYNYKILSHYDYPASRAKELLEKDLNYWGQKGYKINWVIDGWVYMVKSMPNAAAEPAWGDSISASWANKMLND